MRYLKFESSRSHNNFWDDRNSGGSNPAAALLDGQGYDLLSVEVPANHSRSAEIQPLKPKKTKRADTYALEGGGFLHIDKILIPIKRPAKQPQP